MPIGAVNEKKQPRRPNEKAEWLILNAIENAERCKHLLGAVVPQSGQYFPFDNYSPHWADPELNKIIAGRPLTKKEVLQRTMQGLWRSNQDYNDDHRSGGDAATQAEFGDEAPRDDEPVQLTDVLTGKIAAKTTGMQAHVTDLFHCFLRSQEVEEVEIKSGLVKRYKIDNPGSKLRDNLMTCEPWKEQFQKLFNSTTKANTRYLLVTGLLICEDLEVRWKRDQKASAGTSLRVDGKAVLAAAGVPPNPRLAEFLDMHFDFDQQESNAENVFARCKHATIFAVRYNYLDLETEVTPGWLRRTILGAHPEGTIRSVVMDGVVLGKGVHGYAGSGEQENDKQAEDLDEDWFYARPKVLIDDVEEEFNEQGDMWKRF